jgi:hypothetical protein
MHFHHRPQELNATLGIFLGEFPRHLCLSLPLHYSTKKQALSTKYGHIHNLISDNPGKGVSTIVLEKINTGYRSKTCIRIACRLYARDKRIAGRGADGVELATEMSQL